MRRVYWDACCFINYLQGNEQGLQLKGVIERMERGELEIVTSVVTLTEVLKLGKGTAEDRELIIKTFSAEKGILIVDLTRHLAEQSREFIWRFNFEKHKADAIHAATALYINQFKKIDEIHSFDKDLLKLSGSKEIPIPVIKPTLDTYPLETESMLDSAGSVRSDL